MKHKHLSQVLIMSEDDETSSIFTNNNNLITALHTIVQGLQMENAEYLNYYSLFLYNVELVFKTLLFFSS